MLELKKSNKTKPNEVVETKSVFTKLADFKIDSITQELAANKKLIAMTAGNEDGSGDEGSDSEPSEDNLEEEELAKIIPIATKVKSEPPKKEEPPPKVSTAKGKKAEPPKRPSRSGFTGEEKSGSSQQKRQPPPVVVPLPKPVIAQASRSPMKRIM